MVGGRVRIRDQHRRESVLGELEDRAAGAPDGDVCGGQRDPERRQVVEQDVLRPRAGQIRVVARAGDVQHAIGRVLERFGRGVVDRARAERAAEDEYARLARPDPQLRSRQPAVADLGRHGTAGDQVAAARPTLDRERQADAACTARERPVGDAEMAVGLGKDERRPRQHRRQTDRAGHVSPTAEDGVGLPALEDLACLDHRDAGLAERAGGLERVRAAQTLDVELIERVAGLGDELRLGALAADEGDLGAVSSQRVGDRYRRDDVTGRPAGRDHDPGCSCGHDAAAPGRRAVASSRRRRH